MPISSWWSTLVVAEASYLDRHTARPKGGSHLSARPDVDDWERIAELVDEYTDLPLGGTDASVVALAERLDAEVVITLDRRHFTVVRPRHRDGLELLPTG